MDKQSQEIFDAAAIGLCLAKPSSRSGAAARMAWLSCIDRVGASFSAFPGFKLDEWRRKITSPDGGHRG